jgi:hypothetical protein
VATFITFTFLLFALFRSYAHKCGHFLPFILSLRAFLSSFLGVFFGMHRRTLMVARAAVVLSSKPLSLWSSARSFFSLFVLLLCIAVHNVHGAVTQHLTQQDGPIEDGATWVSGAEPPAGAGVMISHRVTASTPFHPGSLFLSGTFTTTSSLIVDSGLSVPDNAQAVINGSNGQTFSFDVVQLGTSLE